MITVATVESIRNEENVVVSIAAFETETPVGVEAPKVPVTLEPPASGEPEVNPGPPVPVPPAAIDN